MRRGKLKHSSIIIVVIAGFFALSSFFMDQQVIQKEPKNLSSHWLSMNTFPVIYKNFQEINVYTKNFEENISKINQLLDTNIILLNTKEFFSLNNHEMILFLAVVAILLIIFNKGIVSNSLSGKSKKIVFLTFNNLHDFFASFLSSSI